MDEPEMISRDDALADMRAVLDGDQAHAIVMIWAAGEMGLNGLCWNRLHSEQVPYFFRISREMFESIAENELRIAWEEASDDDDHAL